MSLWARKNIFFSWRFLIPRIFSNLNCNYSNLLDMRNLQEQVKKAFCYQNFFWPFTVWINFSSDSQPSASNFKSFSRSLEQFFLTVGQNNFDIKIPFCLQNFPCLNGKYLEMVIFCSFNFWQSRKIVSGFLSHYVNSVSRSCLLYTSPSPRD